MNTVRKVNNIYTIRTEGKIMFVLPKSFTPTECDTFYRSINGYQQFFNSEGNYVAVVLENSGY